MSICDEQGTCNCGSTCQKEVAKMFEAELFILVNKYAEIGLNKKRLVHKITYVAESAAMS